MEFNYRTPPRVFEVGAKRRVQISHMADITLSTNEQATFVGYDGSEIDVVKKEWGYYLTPSINKRLTSFGFAVYLVQNSRGNVFVMAVEEGKMSCFEEYIKLTEQKVIFNLSDLYCAT